LANDDCRREEFVERQREASSGNALELADNFLERTGEARENLDVHLKSPEASRDKLMDLTQNAENCPRQGNLESI
jgi:hypothetical protein